MENLQLFSAAFRLAPPDAFPSQGSTRTEASSTPELPFGPLVGGADSSGVAVSTYVFSSGLPW